jgi:hypothetical protein
MTLHPLQHAYMKAVKTLCHTNAGFANTKAAYAKADALEPKVYSLGVDFETYMHLAVSLCYKVAKKHDWPYPYWNLVTAGWVYDKIRKLVKELDWNIAEAITDGGVAADFEQELLYATDYLQWKQGVLKKRPVKFTHSDGKIMHDIIEYIKNVMGLAGTAATYDELYTLMDENDRQQSSISRR